MSDLPEAGSQHGRRAAALWRRWRKPVERVAQWVFPLVLIGFVVYSIDKIGLVRVWNARPTALFFYAFLVFPFFLPPLGDLLIYRNLLGTRRLNYVLFLRKQCLNGTVLDFSGDAYFFLWCRRNLGLPNSAVLHAIKDSNILSAAASATVLAVAVAALAGSGALRALHLGATSAGALLSLGAVPALLSLGLVLGGRRVTTLARRDMATTFAVHLTRATAVITLRLLMWYFSGALPSALSCLEFVTLGLFVSRLPMVPQKGLVYAGAAILVAGMLNVSQAGVAAAVVVGNLIDQLMTMVIVAVPWLLGKVDAGGRRAFDGAW